MGNAIQKELNGENVSARRIARELAAVLLSQLPKDKTKLEMLDIEDLSSQAVTMLSDYARENLAEADATVSKTLTEIMNTEIEHPGNRRSIAQLLPVPLTTEQVKEQFNLLKRTINLITEALDIPTLALQTKPGKSEVKDFLLRLVNAYAEHRVEIDNFIRHADAKWQIERMVSVDRDILRLACAEAFYMPDIPLAVVINEAVELCYRFADEKAAKFLNGILADLSQEAEYFRQHGTFPDPDSAAQIIDKSSDESVDEVGHSAISTEKNQ